MSVQTTREYALTSNAGGGEGGGGEGRQACRSGAGAGQEPVERDGGPDRDEQHRQ